MKYLKLYDNLFDLDSAISKNTINKPHTSYIIKSVLPEGYKLVEYITSTGAYIELDFGFDSTDVVYITFSIPTSYSTDKYIISPKTWNTDKNRFGMGVHNGGKYTIAYGNTSTGTTALSPQTYNDGKVHKWVYKNQQFTIEDINLSLNVSSIAFGTTSDNLKLFYGYSTITNGTVYSYKHYKNSNLICNLIPCISPTDEVGMYDTVNEIFLGSENSNTFTAGPEISVRYIPRVLTNS